MAFDSKGLDDYVDVAQRVAEFRTKHPEGSLQPLNPAQPFEIREVAGTGKDGKEVRMTFIVYVAAAYRFADDQRPGVGCAYEVFPGRTPYTAGSELQNAETAAWGRAIVAALAADTRAGVSSQQEVRNRQAERGGTAAPAAVAARPAKAEQRPAPPAEPAAAGEADNDAQDLANDAQQAHTVSDLQQVYVRAKEARKLQARIADPSTGTAGALGAYINHRKRELQAADKALAALKDAADAAGLEGFGELEEHVRNVTGGKHGIEDATSAELTQAADALSQTGAAA